MTNPLAVAGILGRDREMSLLEEAADAVRRGQVRTVLVGGEAGIGKTRLIREFVQATTGQVLWGGCLPMGGQGIPYLPLIDMLRSLDPPDQRSLPKALAALLVHDTGDAVSTSRPHFFQAVADYLGERSEDSPLTVVFEDLHWADQSTLDLIDFLTGILRAGRVLFTGSYRTDDLADDHRLRPMLAEMTRRPFVELIDLEPLSPQDALVLVSGLLEGSDATTEQAMSMVQKANGNPFFIEELAAAGPDGIPRALRDLLLRRVGTLDPETVGLLRIAAAAGPEIDEALLSAVTGLPDSEVRSRLRSAAGAQVLTLDGRSCRFRHALVAEALEDDMLPDERRQHHAAYAEALAGWQGRSPAALAMHQSEAGDLDAAMPSWVEAGRSAEARFAFAEAQKAYEAAFDLWSAASDPESLAGIDKVTLLRGLAESAFLAGDPDTACTAAQAALDEMDRAAEPVTAGLVLHRLARYVRPTDRYQESIDLQEQAVALVPATPASPERAVVLAGLAMILQFENRYREVLAVAREAIQVARGTGATDAEISATITLGNAVCTLESVEEGLTLISQAYELARRKGAAHEQARAVWNLQANRFLGSRLSEYVDSAPETLAVLRMTQPHWVIEEMVHTADALQMLGHWDRAGEMIDTARREYPMAAARVGVPEMLIGMGAFDEARSVVSARERPLIGRDLTAADLWNMVNLAQIHLAEGDAAGALAQTVAVLGHVPNLDKPIVVSHGIATGIRAAADLAGNARLRSEAVAEAEAVAAGENLYRKMGEILAQPGPPDGKSEISCLGMQCDGEIARLGGQADPAAWERAAEGWSALAMPYRSAYCRYRWAEDWLATGGDRTRLQAEVSALAEYLEALGAVVLLKDVRALARRARVDLGGRQLADPYGLTDRERGVLTELAKGSTNRQIAEDLFISEKTASVHVSNILRKLAAANRSEAAARAVKEGLIEP